MEYFWWLYLATRLDVISETFKAMVIVGIGVFFIIAFITFLVTIDTGTFKEAWAASRFYRALAVIAFIVGVTGHALTPSKKDAMFIAGGVGVIEAAKAIKGSAIAQTSVKIVEEWLNKELEAQQRSREEAKKADKRG